MVVRMLMTHTFPNIPKLLPEQLMYVGLRSVESAEMEFVEQHNIQYITADEFNTNPRKYMDIIVQFVKNTPLHISLDVDSLDPIYMTSTGTPVRHGLQLNDLLRLLDRLFIHDQIYTDIMEYNPKIGTRNERAVSAKTMKECIIELQHNMFRISNR